MPRSPILCPALFLSLAAWPPLGCARPGEEERAHAAEGDRPDAHTRAEAGDSAAITGGAAVPLAHPPMGPFGYSMITSEDGAPLDTGDFAPYEDCEECHERQWEELEGSMHVISHTDPIYRSTAELAREEAGEEIYAYCSGCHAPEGVITGLIPGTPEADPPEVGTAGIRCDVCHQITRLTGSAGPWGEPGNASIQLARTRTGNSARRTRRRGFRPRRRDARLPDSVRILRLLPHDRPPPQRAPPRAHLRRVENSIYAEKGHPVPGLSHAHVEDAIEVAETLTPLVVIGQSEPTGDEREIHPHYLVGANANAEALGGSPGYVAMAEARLKSAARLDIEAPPSVGYRQSARVRGGSAQCGRRPQPSHQSDRASRDVGGARSARGRWTASLPLRSSAARWRDTRRCDALRGHRRRCAGERHIQALGDQSVPVEAVGSRKGLGE